MTRAADSSSSWSTGQPMTTGVPKGKLHPGETQAQATLRETQAQEETGLVSRLAPSSGPPAPATPSGDPTRPLLGDDPDRRHPRGGHEIDHPPGYHPQKRQTAHLHP
jgi:8-oxo-dGTP pyrophosphatase MutT (NUDIX family)